MAVGETSSVALGAGSVWVTGSEKGFRGLYKSIRRPTRSSTRFPCLATRQGVTVGAGSVWVTRATTGTGNGNVVRIDAGSDRIMGQPIPVGVGPGPILYAAGAVFVTNTNLEARSAGSIPQQVVTLRLLLVLRRPDGDYPGFGHDAPAVASNPFTFSPKLGADHGLVSAQSELLLVPICDNGKDEREYKRDNNDA